MWVPRPAVQVVEAEPQATDFGVGTCLENEREPSLPGSYLETPKSDVHSQHLNQGLHPTHDSFPSLSPNHFNATERPVSPWLQERSVPLGSLPPLFAPKLPRTRGTSRKMAAFPLASRKRRCMCVDIEGRALLKGETCKGKKNDSHVGRILGHPQCPYFATPRYGEKQNALLTKLQQGKPPSCEILKIDLKHRPI